MTEDMKLQTTQRRIMRMIIQTQRNSKQCSAAAHAANVDEDQKKARLRPTRKKDPHEQQESSQDADSPFVDSVPQDDQEDELEPWVDYTVRATHEAHDLLTATAITSWILMQCRMYWKQGRMIAPRRPLDTTHLKVEPSDINQAGEKGYQNQG